MKGFLLSLLLRLCSAGGFANSMVNPGAEEVRPGAARTTVSESIRPGKKR